LNTTDSGIRVTYFYSACVGIASPDVRILCDPWFTEGIYGGSWFHYPKLERPLERLGETDLLYISHLHPDHFDPKFLLEYLERYPAVRVLIAPFVPNYLSKLMTAAGIAHEVTEELTVGETKLGLFLAGVGPPSSIDSALAVRWRDHAVVNYNDNPGKKPQLEQLRDFCGEVDIALLPYAGAGAWPQTYFDRGSELMRAAEQKRERSFERYRRIAAALDAKVRVPFAGKYLLGGHLHELNDLRGVPDAVEVTGFDPRAVVLADGGEAWIDTVTLKPSAVRSEPYDVAAVAAYARSLADHEMDYQRELAELVLDEVDFEELFAKAYRRAHARSTCEEDWHFCIECGERWFVLNANRHTAELRTLDQVDSVSPRSELRVDPHYLYGLLTARYHWNNAEIGSQYQTRRFPERYRPEVQAFLNFLHV